MTGSFIADASEFVRVFYAKSDLNTAELEAGLITTRECNGWRFEETYKELGISFREGDGVKTAGELYEKSAELSYHDLFDRILIAQAKHENYSLLSHDVKLKDYNEDCLILV